MSVQNEIERINNNVQAALSVVADAGVSVPENANSNNLPAAVSALANEKQDKLTGTKGQIVGFDSDGKPVAQDKTSYGVATLGSDALLAAAQRPKAGGLYRDDGKTTLEKSLTEISTTLQKKADLGEDGKVAASQLPDMDYAPAYTYGTEDLTAGTSPLETGKLYFVYE